jgi:hypothetical protein
MINTKFVQVVTVIDPDTFGPVEVEIRKMETGPMVGIDGSYLEQDVGEVLSPYDDPFANDTILDIPDDEAPVDVMEQVSGYLGNLYVTHEKCKEGIKVDRDSMVLRFQAHDEQGSYDNLVADLNKMFSRRFTFTSRTDEWLFLELVA